MRKDSKGMWDWGWKGCGKGDEFDVGWALERREDEEEEGFGGRTAMRKGLSEALAHRQ